MSCFVVPFGLRNQAIIRLFTQKQATADGPLFRWGAQLHTESRTWQIGGWITSVKGEEESKRQLREIRI